MNKVKMQMKFSPTVQSTMIAINAALYAGVGIMTYLGIFAPVVGVVRFWPVVIIPAVFATIFGPWVGGFGAAIGIVVSDMVIHGNFLLSLTVGVPANLVMFVLIGYITKKEINVKRLIPVLVVSALILIAGLYSISTYLPDTLEMTGLSGIESTYLFLIAVGGTFVLTLIVARIWPEWKSYGVASIIGNGVGSAIIGLGLVVFFGGTPLYFSLLWFVWTFTTQMPFLLLLGPPILKACYRAFPSLAPNTER